MFGVRPAWLFPVAVADAWLAPFRTFNGYGLFAVMTTDAPRNHRRRQRRRRELAALRIQIQTRRLWTGDPALSRRISRGWTGRCGSPRWVITGKIRGS